MPKDYYQSSNVIIPFTKVESVYTSSPDKGEYIKVFVGDRSYEMEGDRKTSFISQYTAWLDSQSNNIL